MAVAGGEPPNHKLDSRVAAIEAILPTLATKADLANLRGELRIANEQLRAEVTAEIRSVTDGLRTELRGEMRSENDKLRAEMRSENEKLRAEMRSENDKLRADMREGYDRLHSEIVDGHARIEETMRAALVQLRRDTDAHLALIQESFRAEARTMEARYFKWLATTTLTLVVAFLGFFIGLANFLAK